MVEARLVDRLDRAWRDLRRHRPGITGCRVYGRRHGPAVPAPGHRPTLQVNAPAGVGARVHPRFVASLAERGPRPDDVAIVELLGVADGFGSAAGPIWEPSDQDLCAGRRRPVVSSRQTGVILRFASAAAAIAAWEHLERWRSEYGQAILDRSLHLDDPSAVADLDLHPRAAVVSEHQMVDPAGRRLVYLSGEPPDDVIDGTWVAAGPDRFEFHQYLRWAEPAPSS